MYMCYEVVCWVALVLLQNTGKVERHTANREVFPLRILADNRRAGGWKFTFGTLFENSCRSSGYEKGDAGKLHGEKSNRLTVERNVKL
jgi:hypothetical protein